MLVYRNSRFDKRKTYGSKVGFVYCEVNENKIHTITDAYEYALQVGKIFIDNGHTLMKAACLGRLSFISQITFVSFLNQSFSLPVSIPTISISSIELRLPC